MIKKLLLLTLLFSLFSVPALADSGQHMVIFKGKAKTFEQNVNALGGDVLFRHDKTGIAIVSGLDPKAVDRLAAHRSVRDVQPDFTFMLEPFASEDGTVQVDAPLEPLGDPVDAYFYGRQWNMLAIDADQAWASGRLGSSKVTVAILDTGISYTYPDLVGRVDLARSKSFVPEDDIDVEDNFPGMHPITDLGFHGTHVAATVASNAFVTAGVTSQTTLMGVKVCSWKGGCTFGAVIGGLLHAADNGADVANLSLGGGWTKRGNGQYVGFINKVYNYANAQGMTVVVSAGNEALDLDHYPNLYKSYCSAPNVICVSATGPTNYSLGAPWENIDALASYSNYGRSAINVAAPGGNESYVYAGCSYTSLAIPVCQTGTYIIGMTGTSMAAPHVSGLAALVVEDVGRNPGQVRAVIQKSADDLGQPGTDPAYGKGRINVWNAVR